MRYCVFCDIANGVQKPGGGGDIIELAGYIAFAPLTPVVDGHLLFIPTRHVSTAADEPGLTGETFQRAAYWAKSLGKPFNLITSAGRAATQSIDHLHVHYVPRATDDDLMLPWGTLHGENPADPHLCRELRDLGRAWVDREPFVSGRGGEQMYDLATRVRDWDARHEGRS